MKIHQSHKVELNPNNKQLSLLRQHAGAARFAYNWGLARRIELYEKEKKSIGAVAQHRELVSLKKTDLVWMYEVSKCAPQEALRDLDKAYKNFFRRIKKGETPGFPKFKSRHRGENSFRIYRAKLSKDGNHIQLPRIGKIRLKETGYIPKGFHILSATVSEQAGRWFVSCLIDKEIIQPPALTNQVLGIDLGIKTLATCSDGSVFENPKALKQKEEKLKRVQRELSRRQKGSQNRLKSKRKLQHIYFDISNIRKDAIHKATTQIVKTKPSVVVIEDLHVAGMKRNHKLAKAVSDASMGEFRRQLEYKCLWSGIHVVVADRFFPSSKMCSSCGAIKQDLTLSDRVYECECGLKIDRDLNASINLRNTVSSTGINAYGDGKVHAGEIQQVTVDEVGNKQEVLC